MEILTRTQELAPGRQSSQSPSDGYYTAVLLYESPFERHRGLLRLMSWPTADYVEFCDVND